MDLDSYVQEYRNVEKRAGMRGAFDIQCWPTYLAPVEVVQEVLDLYKDSLCGCCFLGTYYCKVIYPNAFLEVVSALSLV